MKRFGRHMLAHWALDPEIRYLNHGTVGAPPRRALQAQQTIRDAIECQPARFLLRELATGQATPAGRRPRLREAADAVGEFLGAEGRDLAFVDNATTAANAVFRSFDFEPGDEVLVTDHTYGAITRAATYAARLRGAVVRTVALPFPTGDPTAWTAAVEAALSPRTRIAVLDHVTSETAIVVPLAAIAERCRAHGVAVFADGAHAPGAVPVDIVALGVDWYTGNLHKWAWAPRGCGILWVAPARQAALHPPVISWGLDQGFLAEFDWMGTRDPSAFLAAPAAIEFMRELGLEKVRDYNHTLAWEAARMLCARLGTTLATPESVIGTMVALPLPERLGADSDAALGLKAALFDDDKIEVLVFARGGRLWARISAQIYNDLGDFERLADALAARVEAADPRGSRAGGARGSGS